MMTPVHDRADQLREEFPGWTLWRSDAGRFWATRCGTLSSEQMDAGCRMTLDADDPERLHALLTEQAHLLAEVNA